jgi:hypothetical protein
MSWSAAEAAQSVAGWYTGCIAGPCGVEAIACSDCLQRQQRRRQRESIRSTFPQDLLRRFIYPPGVAILPRRLVAIRAEPWGRSVLGDNLQKAGDGAFALHAGVGGADILVTLGAGSKLDIPLSSSSLIYRDHPPGARRLPRRSAFASLGSAMNLGVSLAATFALDPAATFALSLAVTFKPLLGHMIAVAQVVLICCLHGLRLPNPLSEIRHWQNSRSRDTPGLTVTIGMGKIAGVGLWWAW